MMLIESASSRRENLLQVTGIEPRFLIRTCLREPHQGQQPREWLHQQARHMTAPDRNRHHANSALDAGAPSTHDPIQNSAAHHHCDEHFSFGWERNRVAFGLLRIVDAVAAPQPVRSHSGSSTLRRASTYFAGYSGRLDGPSTFLRVEIRSAGSISSNRAISFLASSSRPATAQIAAAARNAAWLSGTSRNAILAHDSASSYRPAKK